MYATLEPMRPRKEETESVRITKSVARKARMIAAAMDKSVPDYLSEELAKIIDAQLPAILAEISQKRCRHRKPPSD